MTGAAAQHIVHILQTSIKYSGFVFVSLSLPLLCFPPRRPLSQNEKLCSVVLF